MKRAVYHTFLWWNVDKEQAWLNEKIKKGWLLCDVNLFKYTFESCEPGGYEICVEMLEEKPITEKSKRYIAFVEETGAKYIGANGTIAYFCKKADAPFKLYSDRLSWLKYYRRIRKNMRPLLIVWTLWLPVRTVDFVLEPVLAVDVLLYICVAALWYNIILGYCKISKLIRRLQQDENIFES